MATADNLSTRQSNKIKEKVDKVLQYNLEFKANVDKLKENAGKYARKDINTNFIKDFTRKIYTSPTNVGRIEFVQYVLFVCILYFYNPFNINTKYPALSKLLILSVAFLYVVLFFFIQFKVERGDDVDLIDPTEKNIIIQFILTLCFFVLFMFAIKAVIWIFVNTSLVKVIRRLMTTCIVIGALGIVYLFMKKQIDKAKNAQGKSFMKLFLKVIMFLPCLLVDLVDYIKFQFHLTTKPVWILLGIEASTVALFFLLPYLFEKIINYGGLKLLHKPVNLNEETVVGSFSNSNIDQILSNTINAQAQKNLDANPDTLDNAFRANKYCDPNVPKNKILAWFYNQYKHGISLRVNFSKHPQYTDSKIDRFAYKYALSGWFYINPQPPNTNSSYTTYTNILNYGKKIKIEYNGKLNSLRVMAAVASAGDDFKKGNDFTYVDTKAPTLSDVPANPKGWREALDNKIRGPSKSNTASTAGSTTSASSTTSAAGTSTSSTTSAAGTSTSSTASTGTSTADINNTSTEVFKTSDIMYQKWNNMVVNYDEGNMDVFFNGQLVGSISGAVPYMSFETIVSGANNGIMGGVCNINYYTEPLSANTIKTTYKTLRIKKFPYI